MIRTIVFAVLIQLVVGSITIADEIKVSAKTEAVALFKNGYTVVRQEIDAPSSGVYRWEDVPAVIHGTFFIESDMNVEVRTTQRFVSVPIDADNPPRSIADLAGQSVIVALTTPDGGIRSYGGRLVDTTPSVESNSLLPELARSVARTRFDISSSYPVFLSPNVAPPALNTPIVLQTSDGIHHFLTGLHVTTIETREPITERTERRPVMLFHVTKKAENSDGKIRLFYLTKGATWAPSYRIDVLDGKRLRIEQSAAIRNEGLPIVDTDISLVSGFPQIECANILSPLTPSQTLEQFFRQVLAQSQSNLRGPTDYSMLSNSMMTQQAFHPSATMNAGFDTTALAAGEGPDIHYNSIGKRSLETGDTLSLTVGKGEADYRRVLECDLSPHMLNNYNEVIRNWGNWQALNNRQLTPEVFDVLKFQNPLSFPMTTAPATVTEKSRFLGQSQSQWVNPQQVASIKITKVMNVAVSYSEKAEDIAPVQTTQPAARFEPIVAIPQPSNVVQFPTNAAQAQYTAAQPVNVEPKVLEWFRGNQYIKRNVTATIEIVNRRNEEVTLHLTGLVLGKPEHIEPAPTKLTLSTKDYYPNDLSDLVWELTLKPGESKAITIGGARWFRL